MFHCVFFLYALTVLTVFRAQVQDDPIGPVFNVRHCCSSRWSAGGALLSEMDSEKSDSGKEIT